MTEITTEMLRRFAEAGGYVQCDEPNECFWFMPGKIKGSAFDAEPLPNFRTDLQACFDVADHVFTDYTLLKRNGMVYSFTGFRPSEEFQGDAVAKQDAIILAVLKAAEGEAKS